MSRTGWELTLGLSGERRGSKLQLFDGSQGSRSPINLTKWSVQRRDLETCLLKQHPSPFSGSSKSILGSKQALSGGKSTVGVPQRNTESRVQNALVTWVSGRVSAWQAYIYSNLKSLKDLMKLETGQALGNLQTCSCCFSLVCLNCTVPGREQVLVKSSTRPSQKPTKLQTRQA